jgi:hypothetical protein
VWKKVPGGVQVLQSVAEIVMSEQRGEREPSRSTAAAIGIGAGIGVRDERDGQAGRRRGEACRFA